MDGIDGADESAENKAMAGVLGTVPAGGRAIGSLLSTKLGHLYCDLVLQ
jgi:hypothetical protein